MGIEEVYNYFIVGMRKIGVEKKPVSYGWRLKFYKTDP